MRRAMLLARLKHAYEKNNIPVDDLTIKFHRALSSACLMENALYWEAKADGKNPEDTITSHEAKKIILAVAGSGVNGSQRGREVLRSERVYHGSYRE